jgi:hypothetical protein
MRSTISSRRARGPIHSRWLLVRGRGDRPLDAHATVETLRAHSSTRRPTVACGDLAVCYASVWQAIFAVVEVVSDPEHDPSRERWSWRFELRPLVHVDDLHRAPAVEEAGIFPQSLWRHSYIRLTQEQFDTAVGLVRAAAE